MHFIAVIVEDMQARAETDDVHARCFAGGGTVEAVFDDDAVGWIDIVLTGGQQVDVWGWFTVRDHFRGIDTAVEMVVDFCYFNREFD